MNPEETQGHHSDSMSDDDIASALGYATTLSHPLLPQDEMTNVQDESGQTADESGQTQMDAVDDPQSTGDPQDSSEASMKNDKILQELQGIRDDMKIVVAPKSVEQEVADIRKELEALKNEPNREDTSTGE